MVKKSSESTRLEEFTFSGAMEWGIYRLDLDLIVTHEITQLGCCGHLYLEVPTEFFQIFLEGPYGLDQYYSNVTYAPIIQRIANGTKRLHSEALNTRDELSTKAQRLQVEAIMRVRTIWELWDFARYWMISKCSAKTNSESLELL